MTELLAILDNTSIDNIKTVLLNNYKNRKKRCLKKIKLNKKNNLTSFLYLGYCCQYIEKNYDKMKKYYLMAIENGNTKSMYNLGHYYQHIENNYDQMKKYYLMAIENGNTNSMYNLSCYYYNVEKNYDEMKKYYLMAIENGNINSMHNLGHYYQNIEKNYDEMKKYYLMAIKNGISEAMELHCRMLCMFLENISIDNLTECTNIPIELVNDCTECVICYDINKTNLNFKCLGLHNHYYCIDCAKEWYNSNPVKCLICYNIINTDNIVLSVSQ